MRRWEAIVVGASAGAVEALSVILSALPADFPLPIFIVVHVPSDHHSLLADLLGAKCPLPCREAEDKEPIEPGTVYFAPPDYHLLVESKSQLSLSSDELVNYSRPSIDVLFESAADVFREQLIGVVLTGANHDGAAGLKAIADSGGYLLVQSPDTSHASAMPQAAIDACPTAHVANLGQIALQLKEMGQVP